MFNNLTKLPLSNNPNFCDYIIKNNFQTSSSNKFPHVTNIRETCRGQIEPKDGQASCPIRETRCTKYLVGERRQERINDKQMVASLQQLCRIYSKKKQNVNIMSVTSLSISINNIYAKAIWFVSLRVI